MSYRLKILLIEDEEKFRKIIKLYFEKEGFEVEEVLDGNEVIEKF